MKLGNVVMDSLTSDISQINDFQELRQFTLFMWYFVHLDNSSYTRWQMTRVIRKQTLRSLSLSYQKKDGRAWPRPSFFWHGTDFPEFDSTDIIDYIIKKSVSYQKEGWARGMTTTKTLRSVFSCRRSSNKNHSTVSEAREPRASNL